MTAPTTAKSGESPPFFGNAEVFQVDPANVYVPERIGFLHEDKATALGRLMAVDGQRDPIKVVARKPTQANPQEWSLVVGRHRLRGAQLEGITAWALEVIGKPEDLVDLEASENLHRRPLGPIERAKFTAALVKAAQERIARKHGDLSHQKLGIKLRWERVRAGEQRAEDALTDEVNDTSAIVAEVYGWEESVSDALDMSKRTIHRDLALYRLLIEPFPTLIENLSRHPVVGENAAQLGKIAKVADEGLRRTVIEALLADSELSADAALIAAGIGSATGPEATPVAHQKHYNAITSGWGRLGRSEKARFLPQFVTLLSDKEKADLRQLLDGDGSDAE